MERDDILRVLALNCWGIKFLTPKRNERMDAIAKTLANSDYNIVALQEVWSPDNYETIRTHVKANLPYSQFYYGGAFGMGLAVFSKWPISETSAFAYPLNGRPTAFWRGDWYVSKGIGQARILHPSGQIIDVLVTHVCLATLSVFIISNYC